jgi:HSP20 family protein
MAIRDLIPWKREKVPVRLEEEAPFGALQRDVNRLFDDFSGRSAFPSLWDRAGADIFHAYTPRVDVLETDREVKVSAELPGIDAKDIDISVSHDVLSIRGEKRQENEEKHRGYYRAERSYGAFQRTVPLPRGVQPDKAEADYKKGVLTITFPKSPEALGRTKIRVRSR